MAEQHGPTLFHNLVWAVDGKTYRTEGSAVLARKREKILSGSRESYLMRTPKGNYFEQIHTYVNITLFAIGESRTDDVKPLDQNEAFKRYHAFDEKLFPLDEAFPGLEEA